MKFIRKTALFFASIGLLLFMGCLGSKKASGDEKVLQHKIDSLRERLENPEEVYGPPEVIKEYNRKQEAMRKELEQLESMKNKKEKKNK